MCGLVGFVGGQWRTGGDRQSALLSEMTARIHHRGPDHSGQWIDDDHKVALGHARLAIVDLSPAGEQPMHSPSGRFTLVYNGEIYNHVPLRKQVEEGGHTGTWRGHSDTETLLAGFELWGIEETLKRAIGMFAFAMWDRRDRKLILARDRLGEKPLYYGWQGDGANATFLFGSELKALSRHPSFRGEVDREALTLLMRFAYVPAPHSIYRGIRKLRPGCMLILDSTSREPVEHEYWSGSEVAEAGIRNPLRLSAEEAVTDLESLLKDAVGQQMMADVPLGAFLSGGVDSSTIVALMQLQSSRPVKTFSIGFHEEAYNEARHAKAVANHLGTDHTELYVTPQQAMAVIPSLANIYDEPFADSSQIPTVLVSQLARRHVTVSLSGDAGDELFGGYNRYQMTQKLWKRISVVPQPLRAVAARGLTGVSPAGWTRLAEAFGGVLPGLSRHAQIGDKIHKGAKALPSRSVADLYLAMISSWRQPEQVVVGGREPSTILSGERRGLQGLNQVETMMALDMLTYLPDDILAKVDRAAMSVSLETRVPFLDHRVVEYAWRMPLDLKIRGGVTKWALRQVLYRHVPRELIERPKMGFGVPIDSWLRGPLRDWAEALLDESRLRHEGYFEPKPIRRLWERHLSGHENLHAPLWVVLMFQAWLEERQAEDMMPDRGPPARAAA